MTKHVCGLSGYDPMQDPRCPGCIEMNTDARTGWQFGERATVREEKDGAPCPEIYVALPGGELMPCSHHADTAMNRKRAQFIADAINAALIQ